jgi:hypothetical protein
MARQLLPTVMGFAVALAQHLTEPGVEVEKMVRLVRDDVLDATGDKQEPFVLWLTVRPAGLPLPELPYSLVGVSTNGQRNISAVSPRRDRPSPSYRWRAPSSVRPRGRVPVELLQVVHGADA